MIRVLAAKPRALPRVRVSYQKEPLFARRTDFWSRKFLLFLQSRSDGESGEGSIYVRRAMLAG